MGILDRSESRGGYAVRVLAVHTSEGNDAPNIDDAAALRDASWWVGSSHAIADNDPGFLLTPAQGCVPYERASWTLRSGNRWSENIELIGWAKWTRDQWLERSKLLNNCARWLADRSAARGIPLVKLTPEQYRNGARGVIGHHDHTVGYQDGTHWDPGPNFPWDVVLAKANDYRNATSEEDDMTPEQAQWLREVHGVLFSGTAATPRNLTVYARLVDVQLALTNTLPLLVSSAQKDGVDPSEIAAAVVQAIPRSLAEDVIAGLGEKLRPTPPA